MPVRFELRYHLSDPSLWIAAAGIAALSALGAVALIEGAGGTSKDVAEAIDRLLGMMFLSGILAGGLLATSSALRSRLDGFLPVRLSTPSGDLSYAYGQLAASALLAAGVIVLEMVGVAAAVLVTGHVASIAGDFPVIAISLTGAISASLVVASVAFALATTLGSAPWAHIFSTACFVVAGILVQVPGGILPEALSAIDPFGILVLSAVRAEARGDAAPHVWLAFGLQRTVWLLASTAAVATAVAFVRRGDAVPRVIRSGERQPPRQQLSPPVSPAAIGGRPSAKRVRAMDQFVTLWRGDLRVLGEHKALYGFGLIGLAYAAALLATTALLLDPPRYPTHATVIQALKSGLTPALIVIAAFCGSELVWRRRLPGWGSVSDSYPVSTTVVVFAKAAALVCVLALIVLIASVTAFAGHVLLGQDAPRVAVYAAWLVGPLLVHSCAWAVAVLVCHILAPNRILGWLLVGFLVAAPVGAAALGGAAELATLGQSPMFPLTDMNGLRGYGRAQLLFSTYWLAAAGGLLLLAAVVSRRGHPRGRWTRWRSEGARSAAPIAAGMLLLLGWTGLGYYISGALEAAAPAKDPGTEALAAPKTSATLGRLTVRSVRMDIDLYPEVNQLKARGTYRLRNETGAPVVFIDMVFPGRHVHGESLSVPGGGVRQTAIKGRFRITLAEPLGPGGEIDLSFRSEVRQPSLLGRAESFDVLGNGAAILDTQFAPFFLSQIPDGRGDDPEGSPARALPDRDRVTTDISVSTRADQYPLSIGKAVADRIAGGRRTVRFVSEAPGPQLIGVQSGEYSVLRRTGRQAAFSVYYHASHRANASRLLASLQASFESFSRRFGLVPRTQFRIVEVAGGFGDVQSLANTLVMSERSSAFSSDLRGGKSPDFPSLQIAHEVAHQWWGQDLRIADRPGGSLLAESVPQYAALSFIQQRDGRSAMGSYLSRLNRSYFRSAGDHRTEVPLSRAGAQDYLRYDKGALALFLIADQIGEGAMDRALSQVLEQARSRPGTLVAAADLIGALKGAAAPRHQALVRDLFEDVVIYDMRTVALRATRRPDGRFDVVADVRIHRSALAGPPVAGGTPVGDVEVLVSFAGHSAGQGQTRRYPLRTGDQSLRFVTSAPPARVTIDPRGLWLDPDPANNVARLGD